MMTRIPGRRWLTAFAVGVAAVAAVAVGVPAARAASTPGWRFTAIFPSIDDNDASVSSATNAWIIGDDALNLYTEHETARGWQELTPATGLQGGELIQHADIVAVSGQQAWAFADLSNDQTGHERIVRLYYGGSAWSAPQVVPGQTGLGDIIASGPKDVWDFDGPRDAYHYNGTTWSRVAIPPYSSRAYGSPAAGDWAIGSSLDGNTSGIGVMHLVSGAWRKVPFPVGLVPRNQPGFPGFISAGSPASVWATLEYGAVAGGPGTHVTDLLLHWNGRTWSKVNAGSRVGLGPVFPDGHGGFFTGVVSPTPTKPVILYDYRGGHWTSVLLPAKPGYVLRGIGPTLIPGTTSLIGWGDVYNLKTKADEDAILRYGP